jgi:hypothetical protein
MSKDRLSLSKTYLMFSPLFLFWTLSFSLLFLITTDWEKYVALMTSGNERYRAALEQLKLLSALGNEFAIVIILVSLSNILVTCLMFFAVYDKYKDDITILKLHHLSFRASNGYFMWHTLIAAWTYEALGLLFGFLISLLYDRAYLKMPYYIHRIDIPGVVIVVISLIVSVGMSIRFFVYPFTEKNLIRHVRRMQR